LSKKRRTFSAETKFNIVLEAIKGQRQISEIAAEFDVHPNQITNWKQQFLENGSSVFQKKPDTRIQDLEEKESQLYKTIGEQKVEIDYLKDCQKKLESWRNGN
jgi:transposase-like protein